MSNEFKVVSGNTNVLLIINGKGVPAQVTKLSDKDANEHWRFLVRDDRLSEFFPYVAQLEARETCEVINDQDGVPRCSECQNVLYDEYKDGIKNYCDECGRRAVER